MYEQTLLQMRSNLEKYIDISDKEINSLYNLLEPKFYKKGELLTVFDDIEKYMYIVVSGILRLYHKSNSKEHTIEFAINSMIISSFDSFITQQPSSYYLQACTDTQVLRISTTTLNKAYREIRKIEKLGRIIAERKYITRINKQIDKNTLSAKEMYLKLKQEMPELFLEVPQHKIATYIGVAPESLSRAINQQ